MRVAREGHREIFLERSAGKLTPGAAEIVARANLPWTTLKENVDGRILSSDVAGGFVGTYLGMFARSSK